jgi:tetratricopeptide (TPR) repeat protein
MLETIREYAAERLEERGEAEEVQRKHAEHFLVFAQTARRFARGPHEVEWLDRADAELDNLRAALDWTLEVGDNETALRLGGALGWFWYAHGHALEGCSRLTDLLARTETAGEALRARPMYALGVLLDQRGEPEGAAELVERSLTVYRAEADHDRVATALNSLGSIRRSLGDFEAARAFLEESIEVRRGLGDEAGTAGALSNLGVVAFESGKLDEAETRFQEALELDRRHGNDWGAAIALDNLAAVALEAGDIGRSSELVPETLSLAQRLGDRELLAFGLEKAAVLAGMKDRPARAGRLLGAADALRDAAGIDRSSFDADWLERHFSAVAGDEFEAARADGQGLTWEDALREATTGEGS